VQVAGESLLLRSGEGVFSKSELDEGTRLLLETFLAHSESAPNNLTARVCDLGCGWGAVGCVVAQVRPRSEVVMCDINARAANLAALNARELRLPNARAWCGDTLAACRDSVFDAILCNPPVRAGNATIEEMFTHSLRCLRSNGGLWVVLRTAQGAKSWQKKLAAQFGHCETLKIKAGFRVLCARTSDAPSATALSGGAG